MIEIQSITEKISKIANKSSTSAEFLNKVSEQGILNSFFNLLAISRYESDGIIVFNKIESIKSGRLTLDKPTIIVTFIGNKKAELESSYFSIHPEAKRKEIFASFKVEANQGKAIFASDYTFKKEQEQRAFNLVLVEILKKYIKFYIEERPAAIEAEKLRREEFKRLREEAEKEAAEKAAYDKIHSRCLRFKNGISTPDAIINSVGDEFFYSLGYLARVSTRIYAKVPLYVEHQRGMNDAVDTFEELFPDMPYYTVESKMNANGNLSQRYISFELTVPKKAAELAPDYLVSNEGNGLPGTAKTVNDEDSDMAGGLKENGQLSNIRFIARLINNYGFTFNEKGSKGCAPSLETLLTLVPEDKQEIVQKGFDYGEEVLSK